jgi:hypothetical protein
MSAIRPPIFVTGKRKGAQAPEGTPPDQENRKSRRGWGCAGGEIRVFYSGMGGLP